MSNKAKIREEAIKLNPIDNAMFIQMATDKDFCQEILRVILNDSALVVLEWHAEYPAINRQGRSSRIDCVCKLKDQKVVGVEVEKSDKDDHQRRVRQNASLLVANQSEPGSRFKDIPDVIFIFISAFDIFGEGRAIYHIDRVIRESGATVYNGLDEVYVNASARDGSDVSELMKVFTEDDAYNAKFPVTSDTKKRLKLTEEGRKNMTAVLEQMMVAERTEGREEGRAEGRTSVNNLITILINSGRTEDLKRSATDAKFQQQLMDELLGDSSLESGT